jgi:hypothetical protein
MVQGILMFLSKALSVFVEGNFDSFSYHKQIDECGHTFLVVQPIKCQDL